MQRISSYFTLFCMLWICVLSQEPLETPLDAAVIGSFLSTASYPHCVATLSNIEQLNTILAGGIPGIPASSVFPLILGRDLGFRRYILVQSICSRYARNTPAFCRNYYSRDFYLLYGQSPEPSRFCYPPCGNGLRCVGSSYYQQCTCTLESNTGPVDVGPVTEAPTVSPPVVIGNPCRVTCHPSAQCTRVRNGLFGFRYQCVCQSPSTGDGVNSCRSAIATNRRPIPNQSTSTRCLPSCGENATCRPPPTQNGAGQCICDPGYTGNGLFCTRSA